VDALRQELATWKALAHKQDQLTADQITATQSGATAAKISQIAVNTAAIQSLAAQVAGQISLAYVTTLPATGEPLTLYLVPQGDGTAPNYCNEYLWINDAWELIGTTGAMANNGELSIQVNGVTVGTFTANQATNSAVSISVPTNTNQLVNGAGFVDTAALQAALLLKQNNLTAAQLAAVDSGITAAGVQQIADNAAAIAGKQDKLSTAQQAAVDSGATVAKIDQIASNSSAIVSLTSSKQEQLTTTQLAAVNSGITASAVQQIGTNTSNISSLQTAVSGKAADDQVVHKAGTETITGDKTWSGLNTYQKRIALKDAAAVSAGGFGVGLNFYDYEGNGYGYIQPYVTSDGTKNIAFSNSAGGNLQFGSSLVPYSSGAVNLGTLANKWKSLNGINPGALSLPDASAKIQIDIPASWIWDGTTENSYVAPITGWLAIGSSQATYVRLFNSNSLLGSVVRNPTSSDMRTYIPMIAGDTILISGITSSSFLIRIYPCLGNV